jgi:6-phospho-3-hexuloisomerase
MSEPVLKHTVRGIANFAINAIDEVDEKEIEKLLTEITNARRIFVYGAGRSGLAARAFGMRLVHLDLHTYIIGETITPSTQKDDLFICISGSGETSSVLDYAKSAKKAGVKVAAITSYPKSSLGKLADMVLVIKGKTKLDISKEDYKTRQIEGQSVTLAPMGTLFEDTAMIFFDGLIAELMLRLDRSETHMMSKHSCVE